MKNKSVHSCRFVHRFVHCIMTTLNRLFKSEHERGGLEKSRFCILFSVCFLFLAELTDENKKQALDEHNRIRDTLEWKDRNGAEFEGFPVGMNKLEWDEALEQTAQEVQIVWTFQPNH